MAQRLASQSTEIAKKAVQAALDKQALDILMLDIRNLCYFADYFVICSADSERQIDAICNEIDSSLGKEGVKLCHREGSEQSGWVLLDFGSVVVHIFSPAQRDYYDIDQLWGEETTVIRIL